MKSTVKGQLKKKVRSKVKRATEDLKKKKCEDYNQRSHVHRGSKEEVKSAIKGKI